jgi:hypothetical protein
VKKLYQIEDDRTGAEIAEKKKKLIENAGVSVVAEAGSGQKADVAEC